MARPARPWFRFYVEALSDRKLRRLTPAQRWLWVAVLGAARQSNDAGALSIAADPMDTTDIADLAGMTVREVEKALPLFERSGMVHRVDEMWVVTNWSERQYESDNVTVRTQKHRSKERSNDVPGNAPDTETETDTEKEPPVVPPVPPAAPDGFEEFWQAYPRRGGVRAGKAAAQKQWSKLKLDDRLLAMSGLPLYTAAKGEYPEDAERYLKHRRWVGLEPAVTVTRVDPMARPAIPDYVPDDVPDALPMAAGVSFISEMRGRR